MREILFRGFHEDPNENETIFLDGKEIKGKWIEGYLIHNEIPPTDIPYIGYLFGEYDFDVLPVIPETVGQYIGLNDCQGNKIFENDIVQYQFLDPADTDKETNQGEIIYNDELGAYTIQGDLLLVSVMCWYMSVVGNAFQYPETADNEMSFDI